MTNEPSKKIESDSPSPQQEGPQKIQQIYSNQVF